MASLYTVCIIIIGLIISYLTYNFNTQSNENEVILSRRKRFIVFPEGSSVQLVFCLTFPMLVTIGDIFLYGYTAALAWKLPQDPYSPFDHKADPLHRRMDTLVFTDEKGKVLFEKPYKKKWFMTPAIAKRSVETQGNNVHSRKVIGDNFGRIKNIKIDRKAMHARQKREFLYREHMDEQSAQFHRRSRLELYGKIENVIKGFGANGRECLLKALCIVGQTKDDSQGMFLQEIMRAVLTLPEDTKSASREEYDHAHRTEENCTKLYPECNNLGDAP